MIDESTYVKLQNSLLPLFLLQSPFAKERGISKQQIVFWCLIATLSYNSFVDVTSQILHLNTISITRVLVLLYALVLTLLTPVTIVYYHFWNRHVGEQFVENQTLIDSILKTCHLPVTAVHLTKLILIQFSGISFILYDVLFAFDRLPITNVLQAFYDCIIDGLMFEWMVLNCMVKMRYSRVTETISLLADCPEHLQSDRRARFQSTDERDVLFTSIEVFRRIRDNQAMINGYFALSSLLCCTVTVSWMLFTSYDLWLQSASGRHTMNTAMTMGIYLVCLMYYVTLSFTVSSINKEVRLFKFYLFKLSFTKDLNIVINFNGCIIILF